MEDRRNDITYWAVREITPEVMRCTSFACPAIYEGIREITPKKMECTAWACPAIYEGVREITPQDMNCMAAKCFSVHSAEKKGKEVYLIVGKILNPIDAGLEKKVGEGEALIEVPKGLIDGLGK